MDASFRESIIQVIKENKVSKTAYATLFSLRYFAAKSPEKCLHYCTSEKRWKVGNSPISDLKVVAMMADICDDIKSTIMDEWENSVFSAILTEKMFEKTLNSLAEMETLEFAQESISLAATMMTRADDFKIEE